MRRPPAGSTQGSLVCARWALVADLRCSAPLALDGAAVVKAAGEKRSAVRDVLTLEATINIHKRNHGTA